MSERGRYGSKAGVEQTERDTGPGWGVLFLLGAATGPIIGGAIKSLFTRSKPSTTRDPSDAAMDDLKRWNQANRKRDR